MLPGRNELILTLTCMADAIVSGHASQDIIIIIKLLFLFWGHACSNKY